MDRQVSHEMKAIEIGANEGRKHGLTRMVVASAGASGNRVESDQLSLAKLREALIGGAAIEAFETANTEGRFARWLDRTRRKAVTLASERSDATRVFDAQSFFTMAQK